MYRNKTLVLEPFFLNPVLPVHLFLKLGETGKEYSDTPDSNLSEVSDISFSKSGRNQDSMYRIYRNFDGDSGNKGLSPVHCTPNVQDVQEPVKELKCSDPEPPPVAAAKKFDR